MIKMVLISLLLMFFLTCRDILPTGPETPQIEYVNNVLVEYTRDVTKIRRPAGRDEGTILFGRIFDPFSTNPGGYEVMKSVKMEKIAENKFRGFIERLFVQRPGDPPHIVYIQDLKMSDGKNDCSIRVGEGIKIEGAYDTKVEQISCPVEASQFKFKISKPAGF